MLPMPPASAATVSPARRLRGRIRVPGDKSISHRYALLAAAADGQSRLSNYAPGADCLSTLSCLLALGTDIQHHAGVVTIKGRGLDAWRSPDGPLDAGNSGTAMRMLMGLLAGRPFTATLIGDESLSGRPMRRVIEPLTRMGGRIESVDGHAPITVTGAPLHGIAFEPSIPSAQVKSAVLLAGLQASGTTSVTEPAQTRDHTERAFAAFGVSAKVSGRTVSIEGGQRVQPRDLAVPGDFSSAAFWMVGAAALPGSLVVIDDVGLNPTRIGLVDVLRRYGARVQIDQTGVVAGEPAGTITVEADRAESIEIAPEEVPVLIDELPAVAALAAHGGQISVRGAAELRVKETDRIAALVAGFRALGIDADERPDGFVVRGSGAPAGGVADARGDHRMAMAFAIAALAAERPSRVEGADSVAVSYPGFFETLASLVAPAQP
jgi:3-phosphoshikimate 1-carboxyvinyltransferase